LEIDASEEFDEDLLGALRALREEGYQLALDRFSNACTAEQELLELFDIVKLDVQELGHDGLREQIERLRGSRCAILADGIATYDERDLCVDAGCDLLQGHFFCQPAVAGARGVSANRLALLQVVSALQRPDVELSEVEGLIARDVALSFRMLRYVNSAAIGLRGEVRSIGQALALLGVENARRWATLSMLASVDDKPSELTLTALTRARFCELAGSEMEIAGAPELFTLGLFSVLDALMDTTMGDAAGLLPLPDDMRNALVERRGPMGELLEAVIVREQGGHDDAPEVPHADEFYLRAVIWANNTAESLFDGAPAARMPDPDEVAAPVAPAPPRAPGPLTRFLSAIGRLFGRPA
jgi:EAL and modified HD-GYP domain-containing signal transduction protein